MAMHTIAWSSTTRIWRRRPPARERISALVLISAANKPACLPSKGYMDDGTTFNVCTTMQLHAEVARRIGFTRDTQDRSRMTADDRSPNQVLQMLDADFDLPCPRPPQLNWSEGLSWVKRRTPPAF